MEESIREKLLQAGVNIDSARERFMGNEALFLKFLKRVVNEPNYEELKLSLSEGRYEDAFHNAHTLKGVLGNLSLDDLFDIISRETELLRNKNYEEALALLPNITQEYEKTINIIETL